MLSSKQRQYLRALAHRRKPVVSVGQAGLSESVASEIDAALEHHELIKIKLPALPRLERAALIDRICRQTDAHSVQLVGRTGIMYRANKNPRIRLPE